MINDIKFSYLGTGSPLHGSLIYRESEYSIDFLCSSVYELEEITGSQGCVSLTMGTLQLEVGIESRRVLYPWGLFPLIRAENGRITVPDYRPGAVIVDICNSKLIPGVAFEVPGSRKWSIIKDISNGWIYIGPTPEQIADADISFIEFSTDSVLGIKDSKIVSLLLRPTIEM